MRKEKILRRLEEIETRAAKATPGPWELKWYGNPRGWGSWEHFYFLRARGKTRWGLSCITLESKSPVPLEDLDFVAHARTDVPLLCRLVRELLQVIDEVPEIAIQVLDEIFIGRDL